MNILYKLIVIVSLFFYSAAFSQSAVFDHLSIENGLSQNTIQSIFQDVQGFLWFATQDGLDRYDGYTFLPYREDNTLKGALSDNFITATLQDKEGFIWIGTNSGGLNRLDPRTDSIVTFQASDTLTGSISGNNVLSLCEDKQGNVWVGTLGNGISVFDKEQNKFNTFLQDRNGESETVWALFADMSGAVWAGTESGYLYRLQLDSTNMMTIEAFHLKTGKGSENTTPVTAINHMDLSRLLIGTRGSGLYDFDIGTKTFTRSHLLQHLSPGWLDEAWINVIFRDNEQNIWLGTDNRGLIRVNPFNHEAKVFMHNDCWDGSISSNQILSIAQDRSGILWIGTRDKGIDKFDSRRNQFKLFTHLPNEKNSLGYHIIRSLYSKDPSVLWIGTFGGGLDKFDRTKNRFRHYRSNPTDPSSLSGNNISALCEDVNGVLWVGTWGEGLNWMKNGRVIRKFRHDADDPSSLSDNRTQVIYCDNDNRIWVGTEQGLNLFLPETRSFKRFFHNPDDLHSLTDNRIQSNCLKTDRFGELWVGTWNGLNRARLTDSGELVVMEYYSGDKGAVLKLPDSRIISLLIDDTSDSLQTMWVGTYGSGLLRIKLDRLADGTIQNRQLQVFNVNNGLPSNIVYGILQDKNKNIWFSTNEGLCRLRNVESDKPHIDVFSTAYGLQSTQFFWGAVHKNKSGEMFFGGINGFNAFQPEKIRVNSFQPPIVITEFRVNNERKIYRETYSYKKRYEVAYYDNIISIGFASLDFTMPKNNRYEYKLEGFEKNWVQAGIRHYATYTHLDPGTYLFRVRGSNSGGQWNSIEKSITISIIPPWYLTFSFKFLALLLSISLIALFYKWRTREKDKRNRELEIHNRRLNEQIEETNRLQQQVVQMQKMESIGTLAGGVAHDFNNILTVINGHAELALMKSDVDKIKKDLKIIMQNGERAAGLTNQLLAFSRKQMIQPDEVNLNHIIENMNSMIVRLIGEDIRIKTELAPDLKTVYADKNQIEQIVMNLVVNGRDAIYEKNKMSSGGEILIRTENVQISMNDSGRLQDIQPGDYVRLMVSDSGIGMTEEVMEKIFDPFFTTKEQGKGTGLGLSTVYGIVRQNKAGISVRSEADNGTVFSIYWPVYKGKAKTSDDEGKESIQTGGNERILIVEDDDNVRAYTEEALVQLGYRVDAAVSPENALRIIESSAEKYDLLISDVVMPGMNGYHLAEKVSTINPEMRILLMSGYTNEITYDSKRLTVNMHFIQKPFSMNQLAGKIRDILG